MEERRKVLELVASGQLTVEEGDRLLDALSQAEARSAPPPPPVATTERMPGQRIYDAIAKTIESASEAGHAPAHFVFRGPKMRRPGRRIDDIVSFASLGVTPDFVREMRDIFEEDIDGDELMSFRSLGITPEYAREMRGLFDDEFDGGALMSLQSLGITADFVQEIRDAFGGDISAEEIMSLQSMGITSDYVRDLTEAGLKDLTVDRIIRRKAGASDDG